MNTTESPSNFNHLEDMSVRELLEGINKEDATVAEVIRKSIPQIEQLATKVLDQLRCGGRLFYIGAGTSGRLGIVDASEIPPTFGLPHGVVIGIIAGGDGAIRKAVEFAEDDEEQAWKDLNEYCINEKDVLIGLAASGRTPYVIGGVKKAREKGLITGCIVCNLESELAKNVDHPVEVVVGPEFLTGSTRMKSGTAQKLVLNMITTSVMIQLGRVKGNKMVDMQLSNNKLVERGINMITETLQISREKAKELLDKCGTVRKVLDNYNPHAHH